MSGMIFALNNEVYLKKTLLSTPKLRVAYVHTLAKWGPGYITTQREHSTAVHNSSIATGLVISRVCDGIRHGAPGEGYCSIRPGTPIVQEEVTCNIDGSDRPTVH